MGDDGDRAENGASSTFEHSALDPRRLSARFRDVVLDSGVFSYK
jgi:hypothetical protein